MAGVIGSGIFVAPGDVARALPIPMWSLVAWTLGGVLSACGALAYAELGATYPQTGGTYVYLLRGFGPRVAFVFGWAQLWILKPTGAAGIAYILARYAAVWLPAVPVRVLALVALAAVYGLNYRSMQATSALQVVLTAIKATALALLAAFALAKLGPGVEAGEQTLEIGLGVWGAALVPILWTYDGWSDVNYVAGEVRHPERRLPVCLFLGVSAILGLYLLVNWAVLTRLTPTEIQNEQAVLSLLAWHLGGETGKTLVTSLVVVSTFGALLAGATTAPRLFFAMARDGLFPNRFGTVHPRYGTPSKSVLLVFLVACVFVLMETFEQIITYFVFVMWLFYGLSVLALFRLRRIDPHKKRPYRAPNLGPMLFIVASGAMLVGILLGSPRECGVGALIVALGLPVYSLWKRFHPSA